MTFPRDILSSDFMKLWSSWPHPRLRVGFYSLVKAFSSLAKAFPGMSKALVLLLAVFSFISLHTLQGYSPQTSTHLEQVMQI